MPSCAPLQGLPGWLLAGRLARQLGGLLAVLLCFWGAASLRAETIYLRGGDVIRGTIVAADAESIQVRSERGFGTIRLRKQDIELIAYDEGRQVASGTIGIGYQHHPQPTSLSGQLAQFGVDALSIKSWLNAKTALDYQIGFFNSLQDNERRLEVFSMEVRLLRVVHRRGHFDLYMGASAGYISVYDASEAQPTNASTTTTETDSDTVEGVFDAAGNTFKVVGGVEIFLPSLHELGLAAELGVVLQQLGGRKITNLSTSSFPAFSVRYYF